MNSLEALEEITFLAPSRKNRFINIIKKDLERLAKIDNVDKHEVQDVVGFLKHNGAYQSSRTIQSLIDVIDATND